MRISFLRIFLFCIIMQCIASAAGNGVSRGDAEGFSTESSSVPFGVVSVDVETGDGIISESAIKDITTSATVVLSGDIGAYTLSSGTDYIVSDSVYSSYLMVSAGATLTIDGIIVCDLTYIAGDATITGAGRYESLRSFYSVSSIDFNIGTFCTHQGCNTAFVFAHDINCELLEIGAGTNFTFGGDITTSSLIVGEGASVKLINLSFNDDAHVLDSGEELEVTSEVHISGSIFTNVTASLGNATTSVDLEFERGLYKFFTPPFPVPAQAFGNVETVLGDDIGDSESVWLFKYNESNASANPNSNSWELVSSGETLNPGQGYCIWLGGTGNKTVSLSAAVSYPNVTDLISGKVQYTEPETLTSGMNALGNSYSLPLKVPVNSQVKAYYYYNGNKYLTMAGSGILTSVPQGQDEVSSLMIPSYGCFFACVESADALGFTLSDLSTSSSSVRIKSTSTNAPQYIRIALQNEEDYDDAVLNFAADASLDVDGSDIDKMFAPNSEANIEISSSLVDGGGFYTIQSFPAKEDLAYNEILDVPFRLKVAEYGEYSISAKLMNLATDEITPYLYDKSTGVSTELNENLLPITIANEYDKNNRYSVKVVASPDIASGIAMDNAMEPVSVYLAGDVLHVNVCEDNTGIVELLSVSGRVVKTERFESSRLLDLSALPKGMYIVRVSADAGFRSVKKIVVS